MAKSSCSNTGSSSRSISGLRRRLKQILTPSCLIPEDSKYPVNHADSTTPIRQDEDPCGMTLSQDEYHKWFKDSGGHDRSTVRVAVQSTNSKVSRDLGSHNETFKPGSIRAKTRGDYSPKQDGFECDRKPDNTRSHACCCVNREQQSDSHQIPGACGHYLVIGCVRAFPSSLMLLHQSESNYQQSICPNIKNHCCRNRNGCGAISDQLLKSEGCHCTDDEHNHNKESRFAERAGHITNFEAETCLKTSVPDIHSQKARCKADHKLDTKNSYFLDKQRQSLWMPRKRTPLLSIHGDVQVPSPEKSTLQYDDFFRSQSDLNSFDQIFPPSTTPELPSQKSTVFGTKSEPPSGFLFERVKSLPKNKHEIWDDDFEIPHGEPLDVPSSFYGCQNRVLSNSANLKKFAFVTKSIKKHLGSLEELSSLLVLKTPLIHCRIIEKYSSVITEAIKIVNMESLPLNFPSCEDNHSSFTQQVDTPPAVNNPIPIFTDNDPSLFRNPSSVTVSSQSFSVMKHSPTIDTALDLLSYPKSATNTPITNTVQERLSTISFSPDPPKNAATLPSTYRELAANHMIRCDDVLASFVTFASKLNKLLASCIREMKSTLSAQQHQPKGSWNTPPSEIVLPLPTPYEPQSTNSISSERVPQPLFAALSSI